jgi:hypothetical protein
MWMMGGGAVEGWKEASFCIFFDCNAQTDRCSARALLHMLIFLFQACPLLLRIEHELLHTSSHLASGSAWLHGDT